MIKKAISLLLRGTEKLVSSVFIAILLAVLFVAVYVTIDNERIVADASGEIYQAYKPTAENVESFDRFVEDNGDIIGWLTVDNTKIDYPLVQGPNNEKYVNTSVTGEFSLSGALFLDYRNDSDFKDQLSIIYGHNMTGDAMFGGIDKFSDPDYFKKHPSGTLYYDGEYYKLDIFAYFSADGHDGNVYYPTITKEKLPEWLDYVSEIAVNKTGSFPKEGRILLLSTCSSATTNGRDLLAATISPGGVAPVAEHTEHRTSAGSLSKPLEEESLLNYLLIAGILLLLLTLLYFLLKRRKRKKDGKR